MMQETRLPAWTLATVEVDSERPGYFKSPFPDYPGYIQFPVPLTLNQFQQYWQVAIVPIKQMTPLDWERWNFEWIGAWRLLDDFGVWAIENVPAGEVRLGNIPLELQGWVVDCADSYIFPRLPEKKRQLIRAL